MSEDKDIDQNLMTDHDYDGIQELDNPLPKWWLFTFYITIAFSAVYIPYYHFFGGKNPREEYQSAIHALEEKRASSPKDESASEKVAESMADAQTIEKGQGVFKAKCAACHGAQGQGVIGPNLTDDFWITGDGMVKSVMAIIRDGVPTKGMPPWGSAMTPDELTQVAAYVLSIRGSQPGNPKAPQGELQKAALPQ